MKNPKRVAAGLRVGGANKDKGDDFEFYVEGHLNEAMRLGIITHWIHNGPTAKMLYGRWEMVKSGVSDYTAISHNKVGTLIATEAKNYTHRLPKSDISPEQQKHLNATVLGGGLAFLLARITEGEEVVTAAIPWQKVEWVVAKSAESLTIDEIRPWKISNACYLEPYCSVRGIPVLLSQRKYPRE